MMSFMKKHVSYVCLLVVFLIMPATFLKAQAPPKRELAEWTIVTYIQADNNLAQFAHHNIKDMEQATDNKKVNVLVQWDKLHTSNLEAQRPHTSLSCTTPLFYKKEHALSSIKASSSNSALGLQPKSTLKKGLDGLSAGGTSS